MRSVLVVGGDSGVLKRISALLQSVGLQAHLLKSGLDTLLRFRSLKPALVIIDERLRDMSGSDVLRMLRRMTSAASAPAILLGAQARGRAGDVVLPASDERLVDTVLELLGGSPLPA